MKTINETFTDEEYKKLTKMKGSQTWHDFILRKEVDKHGKDQ